MEIKKIEMLLEQQREYFHSGATLDPRGRVAVLKKLRDAVRSYEPEIVGALREDLGKSDFESYMCEVGMALSEISYMIKKTRRLSKERRVHTPLAQFASRSYQKPSPYGNTLIMSPWNYPFLLSIDPLADAVAAGNTVILKPSAYSPATSAVIERIVAEVFDPRHVAVVTGGRAENAGLLEQKFDMIFFTGSQNVGKEVLRRAAEHLTPAVLELGGKSPCIVDESAKIPLAAKRIVFGKFLNCGQTCVAPDYVLCQSSVKEELMREIVAQIKQQLGGEPLKEPDYGRIVNRKHFERICELIDPAKVICGGETDAEKLQISPTVMGDITWDDPVMGEEIFGPVLPVLTFEKFEELVPLLADKPKPLALYLFSRDKAHIKEITERCAFGGGCINDVIIHLATTEMGFGGVGESGMGTYHGKAGFEAFSHTKSIVHKKNWIDLPMRYRPYRRGLYARLLRRFLK